MKQAKTLRFEAVWSHCGVSLSCDGEAGTHGCVLFVPGSTDLGDFIDVVQQWVSMVFPLIYGNLGWWTDNSPEQVVTFFFNPGDRMHSP